MTHGSILLSVYTSFPTTVVEDPTLETLADLDFDLGNPSNPNFQPSSEQ